jgi:hypothetical protein
MAISWGPYEGSVSLRVGIEVTVSGTTATVKYYVGTGATGAYSDNQVMTYTGAITGSTSFFNSTGNNDTQLVSTKTRTVSPGTSYTFAAAISGAYNGVTPSHSVAYSVPVAKPTAPTGLNLSAITAGGMTVKWTQPSNWGGNDTDDYTLQYADNSGFTGATTITVNNATTYVATGLDPATTYYWRVAAKNSAGTGPYSSVANAATLPATAGPPQNLVVNNIGPASARPQWAYPLDDGGSPVLTYDLQVSTDPAFADPMNFSGIPDTFFNLTGLVPKTGYYVRVRAENAYGAGSWTAGVAFTTLAGAKIAQGGIMVDVPTYVKVGGVMTPVAPQKRVAGAWVY